MESFLDAIVMRSMLAVPCPEENETILKYLPIWLETLDPLYVELAVQEIMMQM